MLNNISNFYYAMKLDFIISYYNINITEVANKLCKIAVPFGKYKYNHLPIRVCIAPYKFQKQMSYLMDKLDFVRFYLVDLLVIISESFEEH